MSEIAGFFQAILDILNSPGWGEIIGRTIMVACGGIVAEYYFQVRAFAKGREKEKKKIQYQAALFGMYAHLAFGLLTTLANGKDKETGRWLDLLTMLELFFIYAVVSGALHMLMRGHFRKLNNSHPPSL